MWKVKSGAVSIVYLLFLETTKERNEALYLHKYNSKQTQETKPHVCCVLIYGWRKVNPKEITKYSYRPIKIGRSKLFADVDWGEVGEARRSYFI